jgi:hypothetical protein
MGTWTGQVNQKGNKKHSLGIGKEVSKPNVLSLTGN